MSRRRGTQHRKWRRQAEPDCPPEWVLPVGFFDGLVVEVVRLEPGAECPLCEPGTVHEGPVAHFESGGVE